MTPAKPPPADVPPPEQPLAGQPAVEEHAPAPVYTKAPVLTLEGHFGIQVLGMVLTNDNSAIEVRYAVTAPDKTLLIAETNSTAYLLDAATGTKLPMIVPPEPNEVQGANRRTTRRMARQAGRFPPAPARIIEGATYVLEIPNWGMALTNGSKVSFVLGEARQDDLTVE